MLLKFADDKLPRVQLLERLVHQSSLSSGHRQWVREELIRLREGVQGEREAAYYLDSYFKDGQNHVVLHDLRFVVDGETAQIDHLVLNRLGLVYLNETKNYAGMAAAASTQQWANGMAFDPGLGGAAVAAWEFGLSPKATHRNVVKSFLNDPDSAAFRNEFKAPRGKDVWCGEVNAKNRLGGMVGFTRYVPEMSPHVDLQRIHFDDQARGIGARDNGAFSGKWSAFCATN